MLWHNHTENVREVRLGVIIRSFLASGCYMPFPPILDPLMLMLPQLIPF